MTSGGPQTIPELNPTIHTIDTPKGGSWQAPDPAGNNLALWGAPAQCLIHGDKGSPL